MVPFQRYKTPDRLDSKTYSANCSPTGSEIVNSNYPLKSQFSWWQKVSAVDCQSLIIRGWENTCSCLTSTALWNSRKILWSEYPLELMFEQIYPHPDTVGGVLVFIHSENFKSSAKLNTYMYFFFFRMKKVNYSLSGFAHWGNTIEKKGSIPFLYEWKLTSRTSGIKLRAGDVES